MAIDAYIRLMEKENLGGFQRALERITRDGAMAAQIMDLIPSTVILPLYFKGEHAYAKEAGLIEISDIAWKNGGYIYFFIDGSGEERYIYERDFI